MAAQSGNRERHCVCLDLAICSAQYFEYLGVSHIAILATIITFGFVILIASLFIVIPPLLPFAYESRRRGGKQAVLLQDIAENWLVISKGCIFAIK